MATYWILCLLMALHVFQSVSGGSFRGGSITWRALNATSFGGNVTVVIHQRYSWRRSASFQFCNSTSIANQTLITLGSGSLTCVAGTCGSYSVISTDVPCTDYGIVADISSGERLDTRTLPFNRTYIIGYYSASWQVLAIGGGGYWQLTSKIDLTIRPDGTLNTSPYALFLPIIYRTVNVQHVYAIPIGDFDYTDWIRCRWSTNTPNSNGYDECGSVCAPTLPAYTLYGNNCTLVFTISSTTQYYAVALQVEDFNNSTSTTPMSSIPVQFLIYGIASPSGCSTPPSIIGNRPNLACIGAPIGILVNETVITQVGCSNKMIIDFTTSSPLGMTKTSITNPITGIYMFNILWTPTALQYGPQGFCAAAIDSTNVQSESWCITFLVGFTAPNLAGPLLTNSSAYPVGTVYSNQSIFSIQSISGIVDRPDHNGTYFTFYDTTMNNSLVLLYDCGWSPNMVYVGNTITLFTTYQWTPGHSYYITLDSGVASSNVYCNAESAPISDPTFWVFDIWNVTTTTSTTSTSLPSASTNTILSVNLSTTVSNSNTTSSSNTFASNISSSMSLISESATNVSTSSEDFRKIIGAIVGASVGGVLALVICVGLIMFGIRRFFPRKTISSVESIEHKSKTEQKSKSANTRPPEKRVNSSQKIKLQKIDDSSILDAYQNRMS